MELEKSLGEQLADLVQREPQNYDVVFSVGPEKVKVNAVKIILKAVSPVFEREFKENWDSAVMKEGAGIPIPDIDPLVFELFMDLIISDTWSVDALNKLGLAPTTVSNLLGLCRRFEISKAIKNLEAVADDFIQHFANFKDTEEFLEMSLNSLEAILSSERIPMEEIEIFDCAMRWAKHQCRVKKIELTGLNFREVLGDCFYEIRFPIMKFEDFAKVSIFKTNILADSEKVAIYDFIGMDNVKKTTYNKAQLPFKTYPRNSFGCSVLRLPQQLTITANPSFACNGTIAGNMFQVSKKISLHGIGFLGPVLGGTQYSITVQIKRFVKNYSAVDLVTFKKIIFARKGRTFHFLFDKPIEIEPNPYDSSWANNYYISYSLQGANNMLHYKMEKPKEESVQNAGVEFYLSSSWSSGSPLAELLYRIN